MKLCKAIKIPVIAVFFLSVFSTGFLARKIMPEGIVYILRNGSSEIASISNKLYSSDPLDRVAGYAALSEIGADTGDFLDKRISIEHDVYMKRILIICRISAMNDESALKYLDTLGTDIELKNEIESIKKNISCGRNNFTEMKIRL